MSLIDFSIKRPIALLMFTIAVVLLGFVSLRELSVDLLPDITTPRLSVLTQYPGVAPEEIETLVTAPLEAAVGQIPGLRRVESVSKEGVSYLTLEFNWGTDMDFTLLHTREKLDSVRASLPEDAESPTIIALDPKSRPIMILAVSADRSLLELKEFAEELVKPRLEQVDGIGSAEITGGVEREIQVELDPDRLALYGLTVDEVSGRLDAFNRSLEGGTIRKGRFKYALRIVGEFEHVGEIGEISLMTTAGRGVVRLKDVARVRDALKEREGMTRLNGRESIGILVRKDYGANTVKVSKLARAVLDQIRRENPQVGIQVISEQSRVIEDTVSSVIDEIIQGAILAFLVLLLFLQEWKTPLIIDTVIPISIIGTFNLLYFNNISLNIMSLGGLALGVGMLDDCAVVVSENIFRHRSLGKTLSEAAAVGTKEVGMAITATALTTIVVFLPVIYVHGVSGQLFRDQALTVTFSLIASLLVSLTLIPMLESRSFGFKAPGQRQPSGPGKKKSRKVLPRILGAVPKGIGLALSFIVSYILQLLTLLAHYAGKPFKPVLNLVFRSFNVVYGRFVKRYDSFLTWSLDNKGKILAGSLLFFAAAFLAGTQIKREFMPKLETSAFDLYLKTPPDYSLDQTSEIAAALERYLAERTPVRTTFAQVGVVSGLENLNPDISQNSARIFVEVAKPGLLDGTLDGLRGRLRNFPDLSYSIVKEQSTLAEFLAFTTAEIGLRIKGDDLGKLKEIAETLVARLRGIEGVADLGTTIGEGKPEFLIRIKKGALEKYPGLSPSLIGEFLVKAVRGQVATRFRELEKKYDIRVRLEEGTRTNLESLLNETLPYRPGSSSGRSILIPIRELVTAEVVKGPREIRRENQQREVLVTANLRGARINQVMPAIEKTIGGMALPAGYRIAEGGEQEEMSKSFRSLMTALILAILLTYMIMAAQFESLLHPFLVLFTLPMGAAGSVVALLLTGQTINVISIIGMVVLVGIVVDNAIVKIDYTNQLRKAGQGLREAVVEASHVRLRPILMSTLSTLFGLIPMALGVERGAELLQPLAIVVIGGLTFSTFLTLILIPVVYEYVERRLERRKA